MIKIFVDSGSSIKQNEKEKYGVEIFPLKINLGGKEYSDGVDLSLDNLIPISFLLKINTPFSINDKTVMGFRWL